jgi:fibronectin type 3 domain-containing protein
MNTYPAASVYSVSSNESFRPRFTTAARKFRQLIAVVAIAASLGFSGCSSMPSASSASNLAGAGSANPGQSNFVSAHDVTLNWNASVSSGVAGYNVYRGSVSGGPYAKMNSSAVTVTSYNDNAVQPGQTYFYVVTSISLNNVESSFSNEVMAPIP